MTVISQTISSSYVSSSQVSIHVEICTNVLSKKNKTCYFSHFSNQVRVWVLLRQVIRYHLRPVTMRGFGLLAFMAISILLTSMKPYMTTCRRITECIHLPTQITTNHKVGTILRWLWMTKRFAFIFLYMHTCFPSSLYQSQAKNPTKT